MVQFRIHSGWLASHRRQSRPCVSRLKGQDDLQAEFKQLWDQTVYIDGKLVSTVNTSKGQHGKIFYISLECASGTCAATGAHSTFSISFRDKAYSTNDVDCRLRGRHDRAEQGRYELQAHWQLAVWCDRWGEVHV